MKTLRIVIPALLIASSAQAYGVPEYFKSQYPDYGVCKYSLASEYSIFALYQKAIRKTLDETPGSIGWFEPAPSYLPREMLDLHYGSVDALVRKHAPGSIRSNHLATIVMALYPILNPSVNGPKIADFLLRQLERIQKEIVTSVPGYRLMQFVTDSAGDLKERWVFPLRHFRETGLQAEGLADLYRLSAEYPYAEADTNQLGFLSYDEEELVQTVGGNLSRIELYPTLRGTVAEMYRLVGALAHFRLTGVTSDEMIRTVLSKTQARITEVMSRYQPNVIEIKAGLTNGPGRNARLIRAEFQETITQLQDLERFLSAFGAKTGLPSIEI